MKKILVFAIVCCQLAVINAFSQSSFKTVDYKDALRPSLHLPLNYNPEIAEQTILAKLKETGYKPQKNGNMFNKKNKQEGFYKFTGVQLPELADQKLDLYFRVDPVDGEGTVKSTISLMVSKGYENFVSPELDSATYAASQKFLDGFVANTEIFQINKQMEKQKEALATSETKWNKLREKQEDARKKILQLESDIKNWQQEEEAQIKDVDMQRSLLKDLEMKRSSVQQ